MANQIDANGLPYLAGQWSGAYANWAESERARPKGPDRLASVWVFWHFAEERPVDDEGQCSQEPGIAVF